MDKSDTNKDLVVVIFYSFFHELLQTKYFWFFYI